MTTWPEIKEALIGTWSGENRLHLDRVTASPSELSATQVAKGTSLLITYTWSHEGVAHEGILVVAASDPEATAAWLDSWHMHEKVLVCQGTIGREGIDLRGSYEAPPGPDWGWRIVVSLPAPDRLHLTMYNCPPAGQEELAVEAKYGRA